MKKKRQVILTLKSWCQCVIICYHFSSKIFQQIMTFYFDFYRRKVSASFQSNYDINYTSKVKPNPQLNYFSNFHKSNNQQKPAKSKTNSALLPFTRP